MPTALGFVDMEPQTSGRLRPQTHVDFIKLAGCKGTVAEASRGAPRQQMPALFTLEQR